MTGHARAVKDLLLIGRYGMLATLSASQEGYPFGSIAPYDIDENGEIVIYVSLIAEHYRNLERDSRASLMVSEPWVRGDPLAHSRATVMVDFSPVPSTEIAFVQERYVERFPGSVQYELAHNFVYLRGTVRKVRWIGGFGKISWVSKEQLAGAPWDPVAYAGWHIIEHMNTDHPDALCDLVEAQTGSRPCGADVVMAALNREGFSIRVYSSDSSRLDDFRFEEACLELGEVRGRILKLLKDARHGLAPP